MRKILLGTLALSIMIALNACGGNGSSESNMQENPLASNAVEKEANRPLYQAGEFGTIKIDKNYTLPKETLFLDIRNDWERANGYAEGSVGGAVYEYRASNGHGGESVGHRKVRTQEFINEVANLVGQDKNAHIILICHSSSRTKRAAKLLADSGFRSVEHIEGGFARWESLGLPVVD